MGQSNLDSFLAAAKHLEICGVDPLKSEDRDDQGAGPQDLSLKTHLNTKKRRLNESYHDVSSFNKRAKEVTQENILNIFMKNNLFSNPQISQFRSQTTRPASVPQKGEIGNGIQTLSLPTGILSANLEKLNDNLSTHKPKVKEPSSSSSSKLPAWSQTQLQEAIESVITQKLRFTQASSRYGIPKGTLYDNILGKSKRMAVLAQVGLTETQELAVLEFCCEVSSMPYNRRTSRSLKDIIQCIACLKKEEGEKDFQLSMRQGFRWWWAFTKKHNIISLFYEEENKEKQSSSSQASDPQRGKSSSPENLLNIFNSHSSLAINIPISTFPFLPFLGLNSHSRYSIDHPDLMHPPRAHTNSL